MRDGPVLAVTLILTNAIQIPVSMEPVLTVLELSHVLAQLAMMEALVTTVISVSIFQVLVVCPVDLTRLLVAWYSISKDTS